MKSTQVAVKAAAEEKGWNISVETQPPQSPQFNALDAGVFNSIETDVFAEQAHTHDELIAAVMKSYNGMSKIQIDNVFLSVQGSMENCLEDAGENTTALRHMSKEKLL